MKDYAQFYGRLTAKLRASSWQLKLLRLTNKGITTLMYLCYPLLLAYLFWKQPDRLLFVIGIPGLGFLLVSFFRSWYNQARPYEEWQISPLIAKDTQGQSFPSRHVFSASVIAMCFCQVYLGIGLLMLGLAGLLAVARVLAGVHYPKDVLVGLILGILWGALLFVL
ncbi:phosphatase PAP2 family protein [Streptococcus saliviloxodontae]|uniref:Membrane-associated phospholipid phosphatase n=1 Tax=Streptococcus saliviloxodontae TaxID=1349416 RepID=A0ABS2PKG8_9STRE|nr:phosphatase PAP2 family protein [Streptococcus saliviloxodontae]MBM7635308.1 membrane-associated phospholipid phosphatase [Streptococcus saliviloxodontae]